MGRNFDIEFESSVDSEDLGSNELVVLLAKTWLKHCRVTNYRGTSIAKIAIDGEIDSVDASVFKVKVREAAGDLVLGKSIKYTEGKNKLVIARSSIDSKIIQQICGWDARVLKDTRNLEPNTFVLSNTNKIKLAATMSYKNFVVMHGKITDAIKPLIEKVSSGKTFVSKNPKEVIEYGKELDIDPNFTYLTVSREVKTILHRGIFPSQKFDKLMHELYQIGSLDDYVTALIRNGLLGVFPVKILKDARAVDKYRNNPRYKVADYPYSYGRNRGKLYKVVDLDSARITNTPTRHNVKAFFASLFCSPRTRKFLLKLMQQNTPAGKAMLYLFRLCANPIKLANAMLYGYDDSHLRKNLVAAAKLVRNLDKFFDREEINDGKILAILDTIKAKRDEQQPEEQGEVNPA